MPLHDQKDSSPIDFKQNVADYAGGSLHGCETTIDLDHAKIEVGVRYKDQILMVDLTPGDDDEIGILLFCPRCGHQLHIRPGTKQVEFLPGVVMKIASSTEVVDLDEGGGLMIAANGDALTLGTLSVEPFECTWELDNTATHVRGKRAGGINLCRWKVGIDKNIAKDA